MKYFWVLQFADGSILDEREWRAMSRESRIDPQCIAENHSPAVVVKLYRQDERGDLEMERVFIPPHAQPLCHKRHAVNAQTGESLGHVYRIGWRLDQLRYFINFDPETGALSGQLDTI